MIDGSDYLLQGVGADFVAQSTASGTPEAEEARKTQKYAFALRRLYRRRQAIKSAAPFTAAIVAVAESWIYVNGTLCHILERTLRILDLHKSSGEETVIDVRTLLDEAVPESRGTRKYKLQLLHYAEGIVSCVYTHTRPLVESWLIVFSVRGGCKHLTTQPLDTTYKIFVRNDSDYLYFGTHSEFGEDGFRRWVLMGYNIKDDTWFEQKVHLLDMVGSDIGQSIAFEIIGGKFYGLSSQASFEVDEVDWKSFYHCFRFPVAAPRPKKTERSVKEKMWRRQHAEGPIDDRWSFIRLLRDDRDPERLQVLESRKEWLNGQSSGRRNYYTTELIFPPQEEDEEEDGGNSDHNPNNDGGGIIMNPTTTTVPDTGAYTFDPPKNPEFRQRCPLTTHPGDDASTALMFTLSKCFIRSYHPSSQTFLDLVDNPSMHNPDTPRLQLRAGSRELRPKEEILREPAALDANLPHTERIKHMYRNEGENKITFWPPDNPDEARADPAALVDLQRILNPPSHTGHVKGTWDDRSMVYSSGHTDGIQALVFISFDPAIRLQGLREWGGESAGSGNHNGRCFEHAVGHRAAEPAEGNSWCETGKGKEVAVEDAVSSHDDATFSQPAEYYPGWSPDASSFDWAPEITGQDLHSEEGETADAPAASPAPRDVEAPAPAPAVGSSSADGIAAAVYPSLQGEPCSATASGPEHVPTCNWARQQSAMYREIAFGFNKMPDFTSPRRRANGGTAVVE
ncbi:hypothetical protein VMCG_09042 [Cytospora schulzeri]|uniref:F-box domain-containing protein n=1 Tax=Cytospora schulzeri TaxID=448051 RepID=A0A423VP37_9PEZI|nr:hypothetical protein VMCG_09042 [Valsa malicola]